jgi:long-chain fatty acid transport protein
MVLSVMRLRALIMCVAALVLASAQVAAQGVILTGVGPVNRAMAGASTAAPIDAAGALRWNIASMSGMASSEVTFGAELLLPSEALSSSIPGIGMSGTVHGEPGATLIPEVALVHRPDNSRWTYGLGMFGIAGFKANYPASVASPISAAQPTGLGVIAAELEVFEIAPAISYALTPKLSIGFAPSLAIARLSANPLFFAAPDGTGAFPPGYGGRYHYGGGVQLGLYYITDRCWRFGASIKSPLWFEDFRFHTQDAVGAIRTERLDIDLPMIVSLGTSYAGIDRLLWALDVRYFDYKNTNGFRDTGFDPATLAVRGLGWSNTFSISNGLQYQCTDALTVRAGYTFQRNPISSANTFYNVASPLILEHLLSLGGSCQLADNLMFNIVYVHAFNARNTGPIYGLPGGLTGTVTSEISADALGAGFTLKY